MSATGAMLTKSELAHHLNTVDLGHAMSLSLPVSFAQSRSWWRAFWRKVAAILPKGLYARALLIVIVPMVILQCVLTFVFMERHWQLVTKRLSTALTQDIAAIVELHKSYPGRTNDEALTQIAQRRLKIDMEFLPEAELPAALPKPFFSILDAALSKEIRRQIGKPFWLDTVGRSDFIEIRVKLDDSILRVVVPRGAAAGSVRSRVASIRDVGGPWPRIS
jgi:two-component system osmolarity sensor histidine kinase EnvZ